MKKLFEKIDNFVPSSMAEIRAIIVSVAISALAIYAQGDFVPLAIGAGVGAGCTAYAMLNKKNN